MAHSHVIVSGYLHFAPLTGTLLSTFDCRKPWKHTAYVVHTCLYSIIVRPPPTPPGRSQNLSLRRDLTREYSGGGMGGGGGYLSPQLNLEHDF